MTSLEGISGLLIQTSFSRLKEVAEIQATRLGEPILFIRRKLAHNLTQNHPRRPRGGQSGWEKRRDESFQAPTLTGAFPKGQANAGS